jgi:Transcription factor WhiB
MLPEAPDPAAVLAELLQRHEWHHRAACAGVGPSHFIDAGSQYEASRRFCATCPVRTECLETALADTTASGLWGGVLIVRVRLRPPPPPTSRGEVYDDEDELWRHERERRRGVA